MREIFAITRLTLRDLRGRGAIWMCVAIFTVMIIASRWLAIWALGEEVRLFKEFSLSSMALGAALVGAFAAVPIKRKDAVMASERVMLTKGISTLSLFVGKAFGVWLALLVFYMVWVGAFALGLWLYWSQEATMFSYTHNSNFQEQFSHSLLPILVTLLHSLMVAAFALLVGVRGNMLLALALVLLFLMVCAVLPDIAAREDAGLVSKGLALLLPDMRFGLARETLVFGRVNGQWVLASLVQAFGYSVAFLIAASYVKGISAKT